MLRWTAPLLIAVALLAESGAGLKWTAPAGWKAEGQRPMRVATYTIPPAAGDTDPGECILNFFGAGQGGAIDANIDRWKGQFAKATEPKVAKRKINGLAVTTMDVSGEYSGMGGPMAQQRTSKPGYRLLGAIVEGPEGNLFVKFTGPAKTVVANQQKFEQLLNSFSKN
jgi:hypothetical protein